ncbi:MAG TPA: hypothetical protein VGR02_04980 [Thermoanaerobaculia bacterium]|nr:hypothetical protein [Thermoanaerobaculia bacterium]
MQTSPPPAPAPAAAVSAEALADRSGDSPETAIAVPADAPNGGVDFENEWIFRQYGRFRRNGSGTGSVNSRRYNIVKIELADGSRKTVYFDITENWDRWSPHP